MAVLDLATGEETSSARARRRTRLRTASGSWSSAATAPRGTLTPTCGRSASRTATRSGDAARQRRRPSGLVTHRRPHRLLALGCLQPRDRLRPRQRDLRRGRRRRRVRNLTNDDEECSQTCRADMRDEAPSWSPDRRQIAFVSTRGEMPDPSTRRTTSQCGRCADGTGLRKRTSSPTWKLATAWRAVAWLETTTRRAASTSTSPCATTRRSISARLHGRQRRPPDAADPRAARPRDADADRRGRKRPLHAGGRLHRRRPVLYAASDQADSSAPALVRITVSAPPPPPPPTAPAAAVDRWRDHAASAAAAAWRRPPRRRRAARTAPAVPSDCIVLPGRASATCRSGASPVATSPAAPDAGAGAAERRRSVAIAAVRAPPAEAVKLRIPAGQTRKVKLQLTRVGKTQLRLRGRVAITVVRRDPRRRSRAPLCRG